MIAFSGVQRTALPVRVTRLLTAAVTAAGQSIVLCLNPARIVVSIYEIAAGTTLREHKYPFVRYAYVPAGTLQFTNTETAHNNVYKAGDFIIEAIGQWHPAVNLGDRPLKLLVIDQQTGEKSNVVIRSTSLPVDARRHEKVTKFRTGE
jgi:quercetin dioxygenase-like cupin family protein